MNCVVVKFGGTSVASRQEWNTISAIISRHINAGYHVVTVCSAICGISNLLDEICTKIRKKEPIDALYETVISRHQQLANELNLNLQSTIGNLLSELNTHLEGARLIQEVSPRLQARIMAFGELASTQLGNAFLQQIGLNICWQDARGILCAKQDKNPDRHYLSATCEYALDTLLQTRLFSYGNQAIVTQGFIASDDNGNTVLLGRGGSDTSAAYLAAKLGAKRCEIWTDVSGLYTANPREIPTARLLRHLDYQEAQEIATMGAKVLHPRCITPLQYAQIPLYVFSTKDPDKEGTCIDNQLSNEGNCVKSISVKSQVVIVSIENLGMWQEIGFLADLFTTIKQLGISVDLISTSETNVTFTLDPIANVLSSSRLNALENTLQQLGKVSVLTNCVAISLVGRAIRSILPTLGNALAVFEEQTIHLVSQAANDLNITFVITNQEANRLVASLHAAIFDSITPNLVFGATYQEYDDEPVRQNQIAWWASQQYKLLELVKQHHSPLYVYDLDTVKNQAKKLNSLAPIDNVFYAIKANSNHDILTTLEAAGLGFECVSIGEILHIRQCMPHLSPSRIIFAPNFANRSEYEAALQLGCHVTLDNLYPLMHWPSTFAQKTVVLRIDPGYGKGHHAHVKTGGEKSKFGIPIEDLQQASLLTQKIGATVEGLHVHAGSGIVDPLHWAHVANTLSEFAPLFPKAHILNLGGGLSTPYKPLDTPLDLDAFEHALQQFKSHHSQWKLWIEPGRFLVAEAGVLLCQVTQLKTKGGFHYIGVNTGMNTLLRPALYGAYHPIYNLTRLYEPKTQYAHIVGPICESADILGYTRLLPETKEGDVILVGCTGAYGEVMSSHYNMRAPAEAFCLP